MRWITCLLLCSCSSSPPPDDQGPRSSYTADEAAAARAACTFTPGTLPGLSLAKDAPLGTDIPIDTVVVLMFENRSFDHLFGHLPDVGVTDVEVAPASSSNPDGTGAAVPWHHDDAFCFCDANHEWDGSHLEWDNGANDGFVKANENAGGVCPPDGTRGMTYYTGADLPYLYGLAQSYAISDHHFCSLLGPTFPNREYLYAATSYGRTFNQVFTDPRATIVDQLTAGNVSWQVYYETLPGIGIFLDTFTKNIDHTLVGVQHVVADAAAGQLSQVNFVDPDLRYEDGSGNDFHPPGDPQNGEVLMKTLLDALTASPQWPHMAIFVTFDENGGLYDHLPPPAACPPDDLPPLGGNGQPIPGQAFDRYGFRVPLMVISPYAKAGHVSHVVSDHTSILRFIEARFKLPALTKRDANADPLYDLFDFSHPALTTPATVSPPVVDQAKLAACMKAFPRSDDGGLLPDLSPLGDMAQPPPADGGAGD